MNELDVLQRLGPDAEVPMETLFEVSGFGEPKALQCAVVADAARTLLRILENAKQTLPYSYTVRFKLSNTDEYSLSASSASGLNIGGKWLAVEGGFGRCDLVELTRGADGRVREVVIKDLRREKSFLTDNYGVVKIVKCKRTLRLIKVLQHIGQFSRSCPRDACLNISIG